jgi:hypothetical protein
MDKLKEQIEYTKQHHLRIYERNKKPYAVIRGKSGNDIIRENKEREYQEKVRKLKEFKENFTREDKKEYKIQHFKKIRERNSKIRRV